MQKTVSERALMARINRKLDEDGEKLKKARQSEQAELGNYYVVSENQNTVTAHGIDDLEAWARDLGVLKPFETLAKA